MAERTANALPTDAKLVLHMLSVLCVELQARGVAKDVLQDALDEVAAQIQDTLDEVRGSRF